MKRRNLCQRQVEVAASSPSSDVRFRPRPGRGRSSRRRLMPLVGTSRAAHDGARASAGWPRSRTSRRAGSLPGGGRSPRVLAGIRRELAGFECEGVRGVRVVHDQEPALVDDERDLDLRKRGPRREGAVRCPGYVERFRLFRVGEACRGGSSRPRSTGSGAPRGSAGPLRFPPPR